MDDLRKFVAPEYVFGVGAIELAGRYAHNLKTRKVFVVSDEGVINAGWAQKVIKSLSDESLEYYLFSDVHPNPRDFEVMNGAEFYLKEKCDVIVAVGGGSVMDCAKAIGVVASNEIDVKAFEGVDMVEVPGPPLICIPTTAGSSADVSQFAIINNTEKRTKFAIISSAMVPDIALIDPQTCTTMDAYLTACTGMDALVHAIEAYVSNASSPITDIHAREAIKLLGKRLPEVMKAPHDIHIRKELMLGSLQAGLAFSNASLGAVHAMAHSLGGYFDLPHGECNAILLPHVIAYNYEDNEQRYNQIAMLLGANLEGKSSKESKDLLLKIIEELKSNVGITKSLGDIGLHRQHIPILAQNAVMDPCLITNPRSAEKRDIEHIYEKSL